MTDDGRLELDDDGRVVDAAGSTAVLDLHDPGATEELRPNRVQAWMDSTASPFLHRHRVALRWTAGAAAVVLASAAWITSRPPYVPPTFDVALYNAVLDGASIGGPRIADGRLEIAFVARGRTPDEVVTITGLTGPGLRGSAITGAVVTYQQEQRVQATAAVDCTDPALVSATASSYRLAATGGSDAEAGSVPLAVSGARPVTSLDRAITDWCLARIAPDAVTVSSVRAAAVPGTPLADLTVRVANLGPQPLTVRTVRHPGSRVEIDLSALVGIAPGDTGVITTRALVHDCLTQPALTRLADLPNPEGPAASAGLTFEVGIGDRTRLASYAVPAADAIGSALAAACTGATGVSASVERIGGTVIGPRSTWTATALVAARSDGIGITFGREHFDGGASGAGSLLTSDPPSEAAGQQWTFGPTQLDGGAGRMLVPVRGGLCSDLQTAPPQQLAVRVLTADRSVHPYEVLVDDLALLRSVARTCGVDLDVAAAEARGWRSA
ncbi:MAG: hypothetical protein AB7O74_06580 [Candidatus Nanopelagicales bacterium]